MINVSIIGTCGRTNSDKLSKELYEKMIDKTKDIIENDFKLNLKDIILISGGAAWSDHILIDLYLNDYVINAKIYLPCKWITDVGFNQNMTYSKYDVGRIANYYHNLFGAKTNKKSLSEIQQCINKGIQIDTSNYGFKNRNSMVANSEYIIAFTFDDVPKSGGTFDTWNKSKSKYKINVNLNDL
jgi:hypothetical protein